MFAFVSFVFVVKGRLPSDVVLHMSDFLTLVRHKPLAGQVFAEVVDTVWFDKPFEGFKDTFRGRWQPHLADLYYVNDSQVVKDMLRSKVKFE